MRKDPERLSPTDMPPMRQASGLAERGIALALTSANGSAAPIVLVVEDEFVVRHTVTQYLQDAGCVVVEAESG